VLAIGALAMCAALIPFSAAWTWGAPAAAFIALGPAAPVAAAALRAGATELVPTAVHAPTLPRSRSQVVLEVVAGLCLGACAALVLVGIQVAVGGVSVGWLVAGLGTGTGALLSVAVPVAVVAHGADRVTGRRLVDTVLVSLAASKGHVLALLMIHAIALGAVAISGLGFQLLIVLAHLCAVSGTVGELVSRSPVRLRRAHGAAAA